MFIRPLILVLAALAQAFATGVHKADLGAAARGPAAPDTLIRRDLSLPPLAITSGAVAGRDEPHVRLGLKLIPVRGGQVGPLVGPRSARERVAASARQPGVGPPPRVPPIQGLPQRFPPPQFLPPPLLDASLRWTSGRPQGAAADSTLFLPPPIASASLTAATPLAPGASPRLVTEYADLALSVTSRMELGGDWSSYEPCDEQFKVSCNPRLFPRLSPDVLFGVRMDGTIADRIRVDVDFDQANDFDAANRINIVYEGAEDDVLRRLDIGDVTFNLPRSRFLTEGIPAGNFGFQADGQLGPLEFQSVWAQQRGDLNTRVFQLTGLGDQRAFIQEDTLVLDDADYVRGQFFFLVDPREIEEYPHLDALALDIGSAPSQVVPGAEPIQLYRFEDNPVVQQQVQGFIQADATAERDGVTVTESGWFRYLQPGVDYFVHPSGLWLALRAPLAREEMLAVTYITAAGDTVGDYNPERIANARGRPKLRLLKASGANHQPGLPTWYQEMHQIYRVSGSRDVEPGSVGLSISLGEVSAGRTFKRTPRGEDITFLRLLGLDAEAPVDRLDPSFVYSPGAEFFQDQPPVQGTFIVFPTLEPFSSPPPLPSLGLTDVETAGVLADDANPRIYSEQDPFERDNAGRFRLTLGYRLRSQGVISSFSLGAFGIRDGSERIYLGDRLLARGVDYQIDYEVGQVSLLDPEPLFAASPNASVRATWEQRSLFQVSPTQVFGLRTSTTLGDNGSIDVLGLYQSERSVVRRPVLGTEPGAALLGGLNASYQTELEWVDRALDGLPGLRFEGQTSLALSAELAVSLPNPNTLGRAFVDDFDAASQLPVSLLSPAWVLGSAPLSRAGAETVLPPSLDASNAVPLSWQHSWVVESATGDSVGVHEGLFPRVDIDRQIRVAGSELREPGLMMQLGRGPANRPSWRSVTTSLSTNGLDLTKTEFLEFYAASVEDVVLVIDLGRVSEDAFFVDALGNTAGVKPQNGDLWGLDLLDQEADPRKGEIWNNTADERGVWGESCLAERGGIYRIGDPRANCTRGNGRRDSEDLDDDGNLDQNERHLRYVVRLNGSSPYLARTRQETGTNFQLYRIPLQGADAIEVGGVFSDADRRAVRHLRITTAGPPNRRVQLGRMRLIGSRWIKRAGDGVLRGISGDTLVGFGRVEVATISRVTEGDAYQSPPGVLEELVDPTSAFGGQGIEFNEKSLSVSFEGVPSGGRAEVYQRFLQQPRNFLSYREARLWVVPRRGDFGPDRPHYFFFKVGSDGENFYLYRTRLRSPAGPAGVTQGDWAPEVVIDFDQWFELRRIAEESLLFSPRGPGDPPVTVWAPDSTYAVVLKDRGRAPNLAAVRELSMGVWNEGEFPIAGEVWIDELRLGRGVSDAGIAGAIDVVLDGAGVLTSRLTATSRGAFFKQLRDSPTYQTDQTVDLTSTLALDRWMPSSWGIDLPVTLDHSTTSQAPRFLANTDVRGDRLAGLRPTRARQTRLGVAFRKRTQTANPLIGALVDGLDARLAYSTSDGSTVTSTHDSDGVDAGLGWTREPEAREVPVVPAFAEDFVRTLLPRFLEDKVVRSRLRLTPERVSIGTSYFRQDTRIFRFDRIVTHPSDTLAVVTRAPRETIQAAADVRFRPLTPLTAEVALLTVRDLLPPEEAVNDRTVQELLRMERAQRAGIDLGWETNRSLRTRVGFRPQIVSWLRNDFAWTTVYQSDRNASFVETLVVGADSSRVLTRNATGQRDLRAALVLDPTALARSWLDGPQEGEDPGISQLRSIISALRPMSVTYEDGVTSRFNRDPIDPGFGYQLGWGAPESFRLIDADTAATLTDRAAWTLGSGVLLPGGLGIQVGYQRREDQTLDTRSDRRTTSRTWPNVQARLPVFTPPELTRIRSVTLSSGIVRTERTTDFGGRSRQSRFDQDVRVPVDVSIAWLGTLVTSYQGVYRDGTGKDPTGDTERDASEHRLTVSSRFVPPGSLATRLDRPVRFSLSGTYNFERHCRATASTSECVPFLDQIRKSLGASLDTSVGGFELGVQMSFDDRQSFIGQRTGSTQFQFSIFGELEFAAGTLPIR